MPRAEHRRQAYCGGEQDAWDYGGARACGDGVAGLVAPDLASERRTPPPNPHKAVDRVAALDLASEQSTSAATPFFCSHGTVSPLR
ncbi:hypothetical protein ACP4OV_025178 [Aristida adscensionis]